MSLPWRHGLGIPGRTRRRRIRTASCFEDHSQSFADHELERHFRRERQILASLNHPNIAKLIDGGVSEAGELFLVMEFIEGEPLVAFAENQQLTIEDRLRLFLKICQAVSFAHQNLVIHRDLKPSNILISRDGEPKLLDFGLAKLTEHSAGSSPVSLKGAEQTQTGFQAFTPAYASPEQILGKSVTTTSDVFSLGVILYELLTSEKPFQFEGKSLEEIIKTVSHGEPSLPAGGAFRSPRSRIVSGNCAAIWTTSRSRPCKKIRRAGINRWRTSTDIERHWSTCQLRPGRTRSRIAHQDSTNVTESQWRPRPWSFWLWLRV